MNSEVWRRIGTRLKQGVFWLGFATAMVGPPSALLISGSLAIAGATLVYGLVLLALGAFDQVTEIAVASFRMTLRRQIEQAGATIVQLQEIAATSVAAQLETMIDAHFLGGTTLQRKAAIHDRLMEALAAIGLPPERRQNIDVAWRNGVYRALAAHIRDRADRGLSTADPSGARAARFRDDYTARVFRGGPVVPPPEEIRQILAAHDALLPDVAEALQRYERYYGGGPPELQHMD